MNVKTLVISAATVLILGGGALVAVNQLGGKTSTGISTNKVYRPYEAAKSDVQQIWYEVGNPSKDSKVDTIVVTKNGKATVYTMMHKTNWTNDNRGLPLAELDKLSDQEVIEKAKQESKKRWQLNYQNKEDEYKSQLAAGLELAEEGYPYAEGQISAAEEDLAILKTVVYQEPQPVSINMSAETDDTGNTISREEMSFTWPSWRDYYQSVSANGVDSLSDIDSSEPMTGSYLSFETNILQVKTVLTHDYWGYADKDGDLRWVQRVKTGEPLPEIDFDKVDTKGLEID